MAMPLRNLTEQEFNKITEELIKIFEKENPSTKLSEKDKEAIMEKVFKMVGDKFTARDLEENKKLLLNLLKTVVDAVIKKHEMELKPENKLDKKAEEEFNKKLERFFELAFKCMKKDSEATKEEKKELEDLLNDPALKDVKNSLRQIAKEVTSNKKGKSEDMSLVSIYDEGGNLIDIAEDSVALPGKSIVKMSSLYASEVKEPMEEMVDNILGVMELSRSEKSMSGPQGPGFK